MLHSICPTLHLGTTWGNFQGPIPCSFLYLNWICFSIALWIFLILIFWVIATFPTDASYLASNLSGKTQIYSNLFSFFEFLCFVFVDFVLFFLLFFCELDLEFIVLDVDLNVNKILRVAAQRPDGSTLWTFPPVSPWISQRSGKSWKALSN